MQHAPLYAFQGGLTIAFFERDEAGAIGQRAERDKARAGAPAFELKKGAGIASDFERVFFEQEVEKFTSVVHTAFPSFSSRPSPT